MPLKQDVQIRVPGKLMLAGEYAVLDGGQSLAVSVDRWLTVRVSARTDRAIFAHSELWSTPRAIDVPSELSGHGEPLAHAIAAACAEFQISGIDVFVVSELDVRAGLGSSSALRLAVASALMAWAGAREGSELGAARRAYAWQKSVQGVASGYDIATQSQGGLVLFTPPVGTAAWPGALEKLPASALERLQENLCIFVGGRGAPTGPQTRQTRSWLAREERMPPLMAASQELIDEWRRFLSAGADFPAARLHAAIGAHRRLLADAPGQPLALLQELAALAGCDVAWSFKTTGAGGEDALLVVGPKDQRQRAEAALTARGWFPLEAGFTQLGPCWLDETSTFADASLPPPHARGMENSHHA